MGDPGYVEKFQVGKLWAELWVTAPHWSVLLTGTVAGLGSLLVAWQLKGLSLDEAAAEGLAWGVGFGVGLWIGHRVTVGLLLWTKHHLANQLRRVNKLMQELGISGESELQPKPATQYAWWARAWWFSYWSISCVFGFALTGIFLADGDIQGVTTLSFGLSFFGGMLISTTMMFYGPIIRSEWNLRQLEARVAAIRPQRPRIEGLRIVESVQAQCHHIEHVTAWPVRVSLSTS